MFICHNAGCWCWCRSCLHVELDVQSSAVHYEAGDHVGLFCENAPGIVEEAARILGIPLDTIFSLQLPEGNPDELALPFPGATMPQHPWLAAVVALFAEHTMSLSDMLSALTTTCVERQETLWHFCIDKGQMAGSRVLIRW